MRRFTLILLTVASTLCLFVAIWQGVLFGDPTNQKERSVDGEMAWVLPTQVRRLGPSRGYLKPGEKLVFQAKVIYPEELYVGNGFQILLSNRLIEPKAAVDRSKDVSSDGSAETWYLDFDLDLPGLEYSPDGPNRFGIDDFVRWQVAPPREPGSYVGYIRPNGGSLAIRGGEYAVQWETPGDLELRIEVKRAFRFLDKFEALLVGLVGSVLSFPALFALYKHVRLKAT